MLESVPGTNQYWTKRIIFLTWGNIGSLRCDSNSPRQLSTAYELDVLTTAPGHPMKCDDEFIVIESQTLKGVHQIHLVLTKYDYTSTASSIA